MLRYMTSRKSGSFCCLRNIGMLLENEDPFSQAKFLDVQNGAFSERAMILALTGAQRGIWFAQQLDPASPAYNIAEYLEINGTLDQELLERALRQVVAEAEALHTTFLDEGQGPQQKWGPREDWQFPIIDCAAEVHPRAAAQAWMQADLVRPADLAHGPLFSFALFRVASDCFFFYQ